MLSTDINVEQQTNSIQGQPKALYVLFFTELWERFSFYGIKSVLALYVIQKLGFSDGSMYSLLGLYAALVYATNAIGGYLADNFLGIRRSILLGGIIIAFGHLTLALSFSNSLFYGLAMIAVGTGFLKPNITSFLGKFYKKNDVRRDNGFTIFYMGINIGGVLAPLICGAVGEKFGWHFGFSIAAIGMFCGLLIFHYGQAVFEDKGLAVEYSGADKPIFSSITLAHLIMMAAVVSVFLIAYLLQNSSNMGFLIEVLAVVYTLYMLYLAFISNAEDRKCILTILVMLCFLAAFCSMFDQVFTSLTLFAKKNVDRNIWGNLIPAAWFQSLNPFFIITFTPFLTMFWNKLGKMQKRPTANVKFFVGFLFLALSFFVLSKSTFSFDSNYRINPLWLVLGYMIFNLGELFIVPVAFSMVTKLAPKKLSGFMMGICMFTIGFGSYLGQKIANYFSNDHILQTSNEQSLLIFHDICYFFVKFSLVVAGTVLLASIFINKILKRHN